MSDACPLRLEPIAGNPPGPIDVPLEGSATIGRSLRCQYTLADESVSRRHATVVHERGRWLLTDLDSRHGTFVNAVRLEPSRPLVLGPGDLIRFGPYTFTAELDGGRKLTTQSTTDTDDDTRTMSVEPVSDRDLEQLARQRLDLLVDCAGHIHGAKDLEALADAVLESSLAGTGFHHAALLRPRTASGTEVEVIGHRGRVQSEAHENLPGFSRSLIAEAAAGHIARLTEARTTTSASIVSLGITAALCAPVMLGTSVAGYLYLDARGSGAVVEPDAAGFCQVIARMCGLSLSNLKRVELERRQASLEADLSAARQAQQFIVPADVGETATLRYAMRMRPGNVVAGDLFEVIELDDTRTVVCIGDVTGEGIGAAVIMAAAQSHLHGALLATGDLTESVNAVNRYVSMRTPTDRFVSMWVGLFDHASGTLSYVDAGHGHWLLKPAGAAPAAADFTGGGIPVGIDEDFTYSPQQRPIAPGDRVVLWSDGLTEQTSGDGEAFGRERVAELVAASGDPEEDVNRVIAAFDEFAHGALKDDTTVASVGVRGSSQ